MKPGSIASNKTEHKKPCKKTRKSYYKYVVFKQMGAWSKQDWIAFTTNSGGCCDDQDQSECLRHSLFPKAHIIRAPFCFEAKD